LPVFSMHAWKDDANGGDADAIGTTK